MKEKNYIPGPAKSMYAIYLSALAVSIYLGFNNFYPFLSGWRYPWGMGIARNLSLIATWIVVITAVVYLYYATLEGADLVPVDAPTLVVEYEVSPFAPGDFDLDGDVDLDDYRSLASCLYGPDVVPPPGCEVKDLDGNDRVDLGDFAAFQAAFGG